MQMDNTSVLQNFQQIRSLFALGLESPGAMLEMMLLTVHCNI